MTSPGINSGTKIDAEKQRLMQKKVNLETIFLFIFLPIFSSDNN